MTGPVAKGRLLLAMDTATRTSSVALGRPEPLAISRREVRHRHGVHLLEQVDDVVDRVGVQAREIAAIIVGTGPGSFTGLRVALATAKTLAYVRELPLVGVATADALCRAAATGSGVSGDLAVVLPAGASDHYLALAGQRPMLVASGGLRAALGDTQALAVDLGPDVLGAEAARLGEVAVAGLPAALLEIGADHLAAGRLDDPEALVPAYVALPRGIRLGAEDLGWSPDLR
jgi:tRNA threonylcarbamoyladenosine biosynthesis protein TsaB